VKSFLKEKLPVLSHAIKAFLTKREKFPSEFGEDRIVAQLLQNISNGFYIDIGAHHPLFESNTFALYKNGWRGINIDLSDVSIKLFKIFRSRDVNICAAISNYTGNCTLYEFDKISCINTVDENFAKLLAERTGANYISKSISVFTVESILKNLQNKINRVDYLNIDCEGADLLVLLGFPFDKFRPAVITIESHINFFSSLSSNEVHNYLLSIGYELINVVGPSLVFLDNDKILKDYWPYTV
jgi:FkbM family methyltransferase